jgi:hypothetical protein
LRVRAPDAPALALTFFFGGMAEKIGIVSTQEIYFWNPSVSSFFHFLCTHSYFVHNSRHAATTAYY